MKQDYKDGEMTLTAAKQMAVKIFSKTLDLASLTSDKIEICQLTHDEEQGKVVATVLKKAELDSLIKEYEAKRDQEEKEKKEAAGSSK